MKKNLYRIGEVIWVRLHDEGFHVQSGTRPAVIIQNNIGNKYSPTIQIIPLTSRKTKSKLPTHVMIPAGVAGLSRDSIAQCEGSRPVSKADIIGHIGYLPHEYMAKISIAHVVNNPIIGFLTQSEIMSLYNETNFAM